MGPPGSCAAGNHCPLLPEAQTPTALCPQHLSLEPGDRGFARQFAMAAIATQPAALVATSLDLLIDVHACTAGLDRDGANRGAVHLSNRYLRQYGGQRRIADAPRPGEAASHRSNRTDEAGKCR